MNFKCIIEQTFPFAENKFKEQFVDLLKSFGHIFHVDTKKHLAIFLANVKAEIWIKKGGKVVVRENLNYSKDGLIKTFKFFRHHQKLAKKYGRTKWHKANQKAIANLAYAYRLGNGSPDSGDGFRYRGVGVLQSTGKETIKKDLKVIEKLLNIKLINDDGNVYSGFLDTYAGAILIGLAHYLRAMSKTKNINESIDIINKYTNSRAKRVGYYYKTLKIINKCERSAKYA